MSELDSETKNAIWKIRALLLIRSQYRKKKITVKDIAEGWKTTERQAFYYLAEADDIFKSLASFFWMQPDMNLKTMAELLPGTLKELGIKMNE